MGHFGSYMPTFFFHRAESLPGRAELGCNSLQHTHTEEKTSSSLRNGLQWAHQKQRWRSCGACPTIRERAAPGGTKPCPWYPTGSTWLLKDFVRDVGTCGMFPCFHLTHTALTKLGMAWAFSGFSLGEYCEICFYCGLQEIFLMSKNFVNQKHRLLR